MSYDDLINNIKTNISKIKNNDYSQSIWNEVSDNFENMSEEIANKLITRKNDLGKINGLNLVILMHTQKFSEQFYDQEYIKELLDSDCIEYCKIMDCTIPLREEFWSTLFYTHQWFFSNDYIRKNIEHFIDNDYAYQRYQNVPIDVYEKYLFDERLKHINFYDQNIPLDFALKYVKIIPDKVEVSKLINLEGLTEEIFKDLLSCDKLQDTLYQNTLWLTVGAYNISEEFIKDNLQFINRDFESDEVESLTNFYTNPWVLIGWNKVTYSEKLYEDNIEYINLELLFQTHSILKYDNKTELSKEFIEKYWDYNFKDNDEDKGEDNDENEEFVDNDENEFSYEYEKYLKDLLNQKSIIQMDDFVEHLIQNNYVNFKILSESKNMSLNLVKKYHKELDLEYVCYYNQNLDLDFFQNYILKEFPNISIGISTYLNIDNVSENNINFFINEYYKKYDEEDNDYFYLLVNDIIKEFPEKYSERIKNIVQEKYKSDVINKPDLSQLASLSDDSVVYIHTLNNLLRKVKNN
jgi:hypothetical protein